MDVTFLESETFFLSLMSTSSLQGEIWDEELNCWDWPGFEDNPVPMSDGNEAVVIQEVESESSEPENEEPHSLVPEDPSIENTPEVSSPITPINDSNNSAGYILPFRYNRGKPPHQYSPNSKGRRSRYPIANYVST